MAAPRDLRPIPPFKAIKPPAENPFLSILKTAAQTRRTAEADAALRRIQRKTEEGPLD